MKVIYNVVKGLITCRRGSAKRAKIAVALTPTSCLHFRGLTTTFFTDKQHIFPHLESHPHQLTYHPFDRNSPSTLAVLILHPPTNALLPPRSPPPNLSLFCSTHNTQRTLPTVPRESSSARRNVFTPLARTCVPPSTAPNPRASQHGLTWAFTAVGLHGCAAFSFGGK